MPMNRKELEELEKILHKDDAFDTKRLIADVDLSHVVEAYTIDEILAEYGREDVPPVDRREPWVNEGFSPKPVCKDTGQYATRLRVIRTKSTTHPPAREERDPPPNPQVPAKERPAAPHDAAYPREGAGYLCVHREKEPRRGAPAAMPRSAAPLEIRRAVPPKEQRSVPQAEQRSASSGQQRRAAPRRADEEKNALSLEEVMSRVVDEALEEEEDLRRVAQPVPQRGFFPWNRRRFHETEPVFTPSEEDEEEASYVEEEEAVEEEEETPERDSRTAMADYHKRYKRLRRHSRSAALLMLCAVVFSGLEYTDTLSLTLQWDAAIGLGLLMLEAILCYPVFLRGVEQVLRKRCTPELLVSLFTLVTAADGVTACVGSGRGSQLPFCAVAAAALYFTMRGEMLRLRGLRDCCHMATYHKEPYLVTEVLGGFRKQKSSSEGFIRMTEKESTQMAWHHLLLPIIITATVVFSLLTAMNRFDFDNFLWYWSAILGFASSFGFTASFGTPLSRLARRLQRGGCAIAAFSGAEMMSRKGSMVLTDSDLFPKGTVFLNGMKVYAHDTMEAVSYAAGLMQESSCGLSRVFEEFCRSQGGRAAPVEDFSFYEEGGVSGTIYGESAVMGRADFMAQMGIRLPQNLKLNTGIFLAVDKELIAIFAAKYMASDNVDAALQALLHNRIRPVFAVRDFHITPALVKRKFKINTKKRCLYPALSDRLALSEEELETNRRPGALLFREGLMPYAETVIGGKRMHDAVCKSCGWTLLGSVVGSLLAFYLIFAGGFDVLSPAALMAFQILWSVPVVLVNGWVTRF